MVFHIQDAAEDSAEAKEKRAALRTKIIDAMSSVAESINNFEQLSATTSTLKSVTQSSGEVTPDSKVGDLISKFYVNTEIQVHVQLTW